MCIRDSYGIIRVNFQLVPVSSVSVGLVMLLTGTVSALVGILYATTETDLKGVLAHSSIENIGIVTLGLGAGVIFAALGRPLLSGMALIAAFYHMLNHSFYKALLFLGAGSVDEHTGTRDLDRLGGLMRVCLLYTSTHRYGVLYFALMASVVLILVASDAPLFLISWECMSILCFLLLNYDLRRQSDKMAGYIMLAMSEAGFLAVVVAFLVLGRTAADLSFSALSAASRCV